LAACGGGNQLGTTEPAGPPTPGQAAVFLAQAGFGGNMADVEEVVQLGFEGWLNQQVNTPPTASSVDYANRMGFESGQTRYWPSIVWNKFIASPDQLRQRMVQVWSQVFVVSIAGFADFRSHFMLAHFQDVLERHALGNFRNLLQDVTLSPAMGMYLNMHGNTKAQGERQPDENYAREVMQLFTIGLDQLNPDGSVVMDSLGEPVPAYTEEDIKGLAAVFTGWRTSSYSSTPIPGLGNYVTPAVRSMGFTAANHTTAAKTFLGVTIPANTSGPNSLKVALDTLFNHPNTGPFIAIRLIQRLVTSNPVPAYVERVARIFADNGEGIRGDLAAVVKAIVLDPEARGQSVQPLAHRGKLREPILRFLQWCRIFNVKSRSNNWMNAGSTGSDTALGQMPLEAPSVFNFYTYNFTPANTDLSRAGLVGPEFNLVNEPNVVGYLNFMIKNISNQTEFKPDHTPYESLASDPQALVFQLDLLLTGNRLSASTLDTITQAVSSVPVETPTQRVQLATMLIMASTDYLVQTT
jgi:uncharacterized protein (DUF1800 family)